MTREVALAIGVADAKPLDYLSGAINGARAFRDWASALAYDATLLTDEDAPVTMDRLRDTLESILANGPIHRLIMYFAGHGLIREAEEGLWLLSDWYDDLRAVAVEGLKRRLYMHDIQQIAIFADSCRSLPPNITAADLCADPVLGRGPVRERKAPPIDKFIAAQDGSATYMVPGDTPEHDLCVFSGVLMEGLWGIKPEAFSKLLTGKITSRSLGAFLDAEVPKRAELYRRTLVPSVNPTFPEGDDIYLGAGPRPKPPAMPAWPVPRPMAPAAPAAPAPSAAVEEFTPVLRHDDDRSFIGRPVIRHKEPRADEPVSYRDEPPPPPPPPPLIERIRRQERPDHFETGAGFAVDLGWVRAVWTSAAVRAERSDRANWWRFRSESENVLSTPAPALIEFDDGVFAGAAMLPHFVASLVRDENGISALVYRGIGMPAETARPVEEAIAAMEHGALRAKDVSGLAVQLRHGKHADPTLGVLSAYLYDSIGDIESIRRMAFYYTCHNQPIPYDVALLGNMRGEWRDGLLWAQVPAVEERRPRDEAEKHNTWTYSETDEAEGPVGGLWPWMRQGWAFLDDPEGNSALVAPGLTEIGRYLMPGRFTTLKAEGGRKLASLFGLVSR